LQLRHESGYNPDGSPKAQGFMSFSSKRASFMSGTQGGNSARPIKQLATFAEYDLGYATCELACLPKGFGHYEVPWLPRPGNLGLPCCSCPDFGVRSMSSCLPA